MHQGGLFHHQTSTHTHTRHLHGSAHTVSILQTKKPILTNTYGWFVLTSNVIFSNGGGSSSSGGGGGGGGGGGSGGGRRRDSYYDRGYDRYDRYDEYDRYR